VKDPTRCRCCRVALQYVNPSAIYGFELDTGVLHDDGRCRDYLFAEVERMRNERICLRAALEWYAGDDHLVWCRDTGNRARAALKATE